MMNFVSAENEEIWFMSPDEKKSENQGEIQTMEIFLHFFVCYIETKILIIYNYKKC